MASEVLGPVAKILKCGDSKESSDKLDMPPPPSPASSTCSDTGECERSLEMVNNL